MEKKVGVCPKLLRDNSYATCQEDCSSDADCDGEQKCCFNGCGRSCLNTVGDPSMEDTLDGQTEAAQDPNSPKIEVFFVTCLLSQ